MVLYIENTKGLTKNLLRLINRFSNFVGHKINAEKCITFLYINNEVALSGITKISCNKNNNICRHKLNEVKDLFFEYSENYKALLINLKTTQRNGKIVQAYGFKENYR